MNALLIELCATQARLISLLTMLMRSPPSDPAAASAATMQISDLHERIAHLSRKLASERKMNVIH